jgi:hypothetical protein
MLQEEPQLAKAFRERVAADSAFAGNAWARNEFFYRRSQWADPEADIIPPMRARRAPPETVLESPR